MNIDHDIRSSINILQIVFEKVLNTFGIKGMVQRNKAP